uniref:Uncharacterized protein n=1 Tax=Oryza punctata TaxID=4537 RepID=A0A0E0L019_ORYPU
MFFAAAAQVPRRKRSRREASMERTEEGSSDEVQVVVSTSTPSETGNGYGDGALVVESSTSSDRPRRVRPRETTTAAAADQSVPGGKVDVADGDYSDNVEKERRRKGKMIAEEESPPTASGGGGGGMPIDLQPAAAEKLMGDAIRGGRRPNVMTTMETMRGRGKFWASLGKDGASTSSAGSDMIVALDDIAVVHDRLRGLLNGLGVSPPVRVYGKMMWRSDRLKSQNRLQISRKKDGESSPFDDILTLAEKSAATSKHKKKSIKPKKKKNDDTGKDKPNNEPNNGDDGLFVQAYDRTGEEYILTLKYIKTNNSYRLMGKWNAFLENRRLILNAKKAKKKVKKAMIDLWVFRSWKLSHGRDDHDDGRLGLVMVHYFKGDAPHADAAFQANEKLLLRAPKKRKKKHEVASWINLPSTIEMLMGDAIRGSQQPQVTTMIGTKKTKRGHGKFCASLGSDMIMPLDDIAIVHDRLYNLLNGLDVSPLFRLYGKMMWCFNYFKQPKPSTNIEQKGWRVIPVR